MTRSSSEPGTWHIDDAASYMGVQPAADVIYIDVSQYQTPRVHPPYEDYFLRRVTASLHRAADRVDNLARTIEGFYR